MIQYFYSTNEIVFLLAEKCIYIGEFICLMESELFHLRMQGLQNLQSMLGGGQDFPIYKIVPL